MSASRASTWFNVGDVVVVGQGSAATRVRERPAYIICHENGLYVFMKEYVGPTVVLSISDHARDDMSISKSGISQGKA